MDILFQMVFDLFFCWPGAAARWVFFRGKKSFKLLCEDIVTNSAIGAMLIAASFGGVYWMLK